ncbi:MAG: M28 family peptidase [Anaerolineales bacterium]|nr:M28 family peptidase [Anaerolineales bacterium]
MNSLMKFIGRLLNPRSNLDDLPSIVDPGGTGSDSETAIKPAARVHFRDVISNIPLMVGGIIVLGLFIMVLFGPLWAPENPYLAGQHVKSDFEDEADLYSFPPYPPSDRFPLGTDQWGNDLLSLLLYGARNTLVACAFITMVRVILGLILGGIAGWNAGKGSDQIIMGITGVITSIPILISSIILILALDIRGGLVVFIVALSIIGWTEIAQYIRSEFIVLKKMPFIESAHSVGSTGNATAIRHILPNVLPQLLIITFLEMGAVMMLLGELGFTGIFIGGGSRIQIVFDDVNIQTTRLAEIPEWGAMLAGGFRYLRSQPYVVFPAAVAFFVAVFGFNTFGEGLRRLVEQSAFNTSFLMRKRMIFVFGGLTLATVFIINRTGPGPWFAQLAEAFNGDLAYEHVATLSEMEGRGLGQEGGFDSANYITEKFEEYGLRPGWRNDTYTYLLPGYSVLPIEQPYLAILNEDGSNLEFRHQLDFGFITHGHGGSGSVQAPVTFIGFDSSTTTRRESFIGLDLRDQIILLLEENAPPEFATEALIRGARGVLWITGDKHQDVRSETVIVDPEMDMTRTPTIPIFRIRSSIARQIMAESALSLSSLFDPMGVNDQEGPGWFAREMNVIIEMSLKLSEKEAVEIPQVLGFLPGSDLDIADEMVVLIANYDGLGIEPDGTIFQAANHDASGIGILLEVARLWNEQKLGPRRSVLFVAWGGEISGEYGASAFLEDRRNFRLLPTRNPTSNLGARAIFHLDNVGAGGETAFIHPDSSTALIELILDTSAEVGVPIQIADEDTGLDEPMINTRIPAIQVRWVDSSYMPDLDQIKNIDAQKLQDLGEVIALALTTVSRQTTY